MWEHNYFFLGAENGLAAEWPGASPLHSSFPGGGGVGPCQFCRRGFPNESVLLSHKQHEHGELKEVRQARGRLGPENPPPPPLCGWSRVSLFFSPSTTHSVNFCIFWIFHFMQGLPDWAGLPPPFPPPPSPPADSGWEVRTQELQQDVCPPPLQHLCRTTHPHSCFYRFVSLRHILLDFQKRS